MALYPRILDEWTTEIAGWIEHGLPRSVEARFWGNLLVLFEREPDSAIPSRAKRIDDTLYELRIHVEAVEGMGRHYVFIVRLCLAADGYADFDHCSAFGRGPDGKLFWSSP